MTASMCQCVCVFVVVCFVLRLQSYHIIYIL